jgi:hypothetical protein
VSPADLVRVAFDLHRRGAISRDVLLDIVSGCIDAAARTNGYAERHGLPSRQGRAYHPHRED